MQPINGRLHFNVTRHSLKLTTVSCWPTAAVKNQLSTTASVLGKESIDITRTPRTFDEVDIAHYKQAIAKPGAHTAAINDYRALFRASQSITRPAFHPSPVLGINSS